jgi:hypothetical protein
MREESCTTSWRLKKLHAAGTANRAYCRAERKRKEKKLENLKMPKVHVISGIDASQVIIRTCVRNHVDSQSTLRKNHAAE